MYHGRHRTAEIRFPTRMVGSYPVSADHDPETLSHLLSLAVHELRTPVTVVSGYIRMLLREQGGPLTEKQQRMLTEAERSCGRIAELVAELSEVGKLEGRTLPIAHQTFDIRAVVSEVASDMHEGQDRGVRLDVDAGDHPLMVAADRARVAALVKATVHSVLRERGEPGVILVRCARLGAETPAWGVVAAGDPAIIESLLTTGPGESGAFDEYRGGLGLAFPLGRRLLDALGGALWSLPEHPRGGIALRLPLTTLD